MLYCIYDQQNQKVKLGISKNPSLSKQLQTANASKLQLLWTFEPCDRSCGCTMCDWNNDYTKNLIITVVGRIQNGLIHVYSSG
nr:hypothetical protein [Fischerella sp. PCC 9605]